MYQFFRIDSNNNIISLYTNNLSEELVRILKEKGNVTDGNWLLTAACDISYIKSIDQKSTHNAHIN